MPQRQHYWYILRCLVIIRIVVYDVLSETRDGVYIVRQNDGKCIYRTGTYRDAFATNVGKFF
jgi:coenzyme F420-reducing hydrogenase delta subunit